MLGLRLCARSTCIARPGERYLNKYLGHHVNLATQKLPLTNISRDFARASGSAGKPNWAANLGLKDSFFSKKKDAEEFRSLIVRLKQLNARGNYHEVIDHFKVSGKKLATAPLANDLLPLRNELSAVYLEAFMRTGQMRDPDVHALYPPVVLVTTYGSGGGSGGAGGAGGAAGEEGVKPIEVVLVKKKFWGGRFGWIEALWAIAITLGVVTILSFFVTINLDVESGPGDLMMFRNTHRQATSSDVKFSDVLGIDECKSELEEVVEFLRSPRKFQEMGAKLPRGVLLIGPPGTGKTLLAKAVAGEAGVPFFFTSASEFDEIFVGVGARRIRNLFAEAKKNAPSIIFIDEIDAIGPARRMDRLHSQNGSLMQLLNEIDGFQQHEGVVVIAATNSPDSLDEALKRPGRFDKKIFVPLPDIKGRQQIITYYLNKVRHASGLNILGLARATIGMSGADLANLVNIAAIKAANEPKATVNDDVLNKAFDDIIMGIARKSAVIPQKEKKLTAYHEGGHALVGLLTQGSKPIHKATIVPRGGALGMVNQQVVNEWSETRQEMMADIAIALGGRIAEELIFGENEVTGGASSDLKMATRRAEQMFQRFGMSEAIGLVAYDEDSKLSHHTRHLIEQEVQSILSQQYRYVQELLRNHLPELHAIAEALLEHETLTGDQLSDVIQGKTITPASGSSNVKGDDGSVKGQGGKEEKGANII